MIAVAFRWAEAVMQVKSPFSVFWHCMDDQPTDQPTDRQTNRGRACTQLKSLQSCLHSDQTMNKM